MNGTTPAPVNARIKSTTLGYEDHGLLTIWLNLEGSGWGQGFGGYRLDGPKDSCTPHLHRWTSGIMKALEVRTWEELPNTFVRIKRDERNDKIIAVGHILKDQWFYAKEDDNG